jgi:hypothetical protein
MLVPTKTKELNEPRKYVVTGTRVQFRQNETKDNPYKEY